MKKTIVKKLVEDYNSYSELVALNYAKIKEGKCDDGTLQWNRGHLYQIESYLKELATMLQITLYWECGDHSFGYDDWKRVLNYRTVRVDLEELES